VFLGAFVKSEAELLEISCACLSTLANVEWR